jgi:hypothetical protein
MKREALRHPKLYHLMDLLKCRRVEALGYLTLMWDFAKDSALPGDIGKWTDGAIANASDWLGEPAVFVEALVASKWLDRHEHYRLLIHDWEAHAESWMKAKMAKLGLHFARPTDISKPNSAAEMAEATRERSREPTTNLTEPNQTNPLRPEEVDFSILEVSDLRSPGKLLGWIRENWPQAEVTEPHVLNIFGAAVKSLAEGDKPVGMFVSIVKRNKWRSINKTHQKLARENLASITVPAKEVHATK